LSKGVIEGVKVIPLKRIPDERGTIYHMLKRTDPHFSAFGEIYFSTVHPGVVKGWHRHKNMTLHYACVHGRIKLVIFDERDGSKTKGELMELFLGPDNYCLVVIPPDLWNGFKGMGDQTAILADLIDIPHEQADSLRIDPHDNHIPYDWSVKEQ
jgi:dTDP-4-dehydrorhamnose 3,5-epimerase